MKTPNPQYAARAKPSNASFNTEAVDSDGAEVLWFEIVIDDASDPDFTITVMQGLTAATVARASFDAADGSEPTGVSVLSGQILVDGSALTADATLVVAVHKPAPYVRLDFAATGGGTTGDRVNVKFHLR